MAFRVKDVVRSAVGLAVVFGVVHGGESVWGRWTRRTPTYAKDAAPILASECIGCHREGGIAPFPLVTDEQAKERAADIAKNAENRHMPPFNLDNSGSCNTYSDARWLDDTKIATLRAWALGGAPLGEEAKSAPLTPPPLPALDRVDLTVDMGAPYTPD